MPLVVVMEVYVQLVCESVTYVRTYIRNYYSVVSIHHHYEYEGSGVAKRCVHCSLLPASRSWVDPTCCEPGIRGPPLLAMVRGLAANVEVLLVQHMRLSFTITDLQLRMSVRTVFAIANICIFTTCSVFYSTSILLLLHK